MLATLTAVFKDGMGGLIAPTITSARIDASGVTRVQFFMVIGLNTVLFFALAIFDEWFRCPHDIILQNGKIFSLRYYNGMVTMAFVISVLALATAWIGPKFTVWLVTIWGGRASERDAVGWIYLTTASFIVLNSIFSLIEILLNFITGFSDWLEINYWIFYIIAFMPFLAVMIIIGMRLLKMPSIIRMIGISVTWYIATLGLFLVALYPMFYFYELHLENI